MRGGASLLLAALFAGCQPLHFYELPVADASALVAGVESGSRWQLLASVDRGALQFDLSSAPDLVELLAYTQTLASLGIDPGPVAGQASCRRSCALLQPAHVFQRGRDEAAWREVAGPSSALARVLMPDLERCSPSCTPLASERLVLDSEARVAFAVRDGDRGGVVALTNGELVGIGASGEPSRLCGPGALQPTAGFLAPGDDRVWIADRSGAIGALDLRALDPATPCAITTATVTPELMIRLSGSLPSEPLELFALSEHGLIGRVDGGGWHGLARVPLVERVPPQERIEQGAIVRLGPGRAFASAGGKHVAWVEDAQVEISEVDIGAQTTPEVTTARLLGGERLVAGLHWTGIAEVKRGPWRTLTSRNGYIDPGAILELRGALLFTLENGLLGQLVEGIDDCDIQRFDSQGSSAWAVEMSPDLLLIPDNQLHEFPGEATFVTRLRPVGDVACSSE